MNNKYIASYQGRQCSVFIREHAMGRMNERGFTLAELDKIMLHVSPLLLFLVEEGLEVNIVDEGSQKTVSLGMQVHTDNYLTMHIYTIIDNRYRHPERNNLVIKEDGLVTFSPNRQWEQNNPHKLIITKGEYKL